MTNPKKKTKIVYIVVNVKNTISILKYFEVLALVENYLLRHPAS
jgi:hypothetical protein